LWADVCPGFLAFLTVPFLVKLYRKWLGNQLTDEERAPGVAGVRAWLGGGNLIVALLISVFAAVGFGYSFWSIGALTLMALLAYPVLNMTDASLKPAEPKPDTGLSAERDRVLRMLDDGKITAEESAELLHALGQTAQPRLPSATTVSPHRKMMLIGCALLLIGFFLPWFSYNPGVEFSRVVNDFQRQVAPQETHVALNLPVSMTTRITGGDIRYGLGWMVLLLGLAVAALPYVANNLDSRIQQKVQLIGLAIGGIILIYLLTQNIRFVSVGIVLGLGGYALELLGTVREGKPA
jgi:hypothetical protein